MKIVCFCLSSNYMGFCAVGCLKKSNIYYKYWQICDSLQWINEWITGLFQAIYWKSRQKRWQKDTNVSVCIFWIHLLLHLEHNGSVSLKMLTCLLVILIFNCWIIAIEINFNRNYFILKTKGMSHAICFMRYVTNMSE